MYHILNINTAATSWALTFGWQKIKIFKQSKINNIINNFTFGYDGVYYQMTYEF